MITRVKNILLTDRYQRPVATDIFLEENGMGKPAVIYAHGFNGFKDWGNFDLIAEQFAAAGFVFVKFNFSFNGTTPEHPEDFVDLDAYAANNYTKELSNLRAVTDWVCSAENPFHKEIDVHNVSLLGHSLGGGIVILGAAADDQIKAVVTWASVSRCKTPWGSWPEEKMQEWRDTGVAYITNSRTGQYMPLRYQLYEDFEANKERLDIAQHIKKLHIPLLICHGTGDPSVPVTSAYELKSWHPGAELFITPGDHVFGRKHPWPDNHLPDAMQRVVIKTIHFLENASR